MAKDSKIEERLERVEEIIEQLDPDECSLDDGENLYEEDTDSMWRFVTLSGNPSKVTERE